MPRASGGVSSTTSSWFFATTNLTAASAFVGSCYVFDIWVEPAGFVFVNIPGAWFPVNGTVPIALNLSTPSAPFGPGPIYIHFDTSTTPGCGTCP